MTRKSLAGFARKLTTAKAIGSKKQLKDAIQGISNEFPGLAQVARMALNPITLAVAGIAAAFSIWETRMKNAMDVLGGVEMPDITDDQLKNYDAAASSWEKFAEQVKQTAEAYNSVVAASERMERGIDKQAGREKRRLENQKKIELATLEMKKGEMTETEYAAKRARIEGQYERGEMAIEERAEQRKLAEKGRRLANLQAEAEKKEREARGINPASEKDEARIDREQREAAEFAVQQQKQAKDRLKRLQQMSVDPLERAKGTWWYATTYGPGIHGEEARDLERQEIERQQIVIDRYDSWQQSKVGRQGQRRRRDQLLGDAAKDRGAAYVLGQELPTLTNDFNEQRRLNQESATANDFSRFGQAVQQADADQKRLVAEATQQVERTGAVARGTAEALSRQAELNELFTREIKRLNTQIGNLRAH